MWVAHLRAGGTSGAPSRLDPLLAERQVVMCGVVAAELLTGLAPDRRVELWHLFEGIGWIELDRAAWRRVGDASAELRARGAMTPLTDIAIAVTALTGGAELWAEDVHFDRIAESLPDLRRYSPR